MSGAVTQNQAIAVVLMGFLAVWAVTAARLPEKDATSVRTICIFVAAAAIALIERT